MSEFNEPWRVEKENYDPHIFSTAFGGKLTILSSDFDPEYPEQGNSYTLPDMKTAERIALAVNFCRGLSNEAMAAHLHTEKPAIDWLEACLELINSSEGDAK